MFIFQVDVMAYGMEKENIEGELQVLEEVLAALDGELIGTEAGIDQRSFVVYLRAESELMVSDIFECSFFTAERIACVKVPFDAPIGFNRAASQKTLLHANAPC